MSMEDYPKTWEEAYEGYNALVWQKANQIGLKYHVDKEDLAQEGFLVLKKCVDNFEPERGIKFITFAFTAIVRELVRYCRQHRQTIRTPQRNNYTVGMESLDAPATESDGENRTLAEIIPDKCQFEKLMLEEDTGLKLKKFLSSLNDKEREIMDDYYGLTSGVQSTLEVVSTKYGVTHQRIRQIIHNAIDKFNHKPTKSQLHYMTIRNPRNDGKYIHTDWSTLAELKLGGEVTIEYKGNSPISAALAGQGRKHGHHFVAERVDETHYKITIGEKWKRGTKRKKNQTIIPAGVASPLPDPRETALPPSKRPTVAKRIGAKRTATPPTKSQMIKLEAPAFTFAELEEVFIAKSMLPHGVNLETAVKFYLKEMDRMRELVHACEK